MDITGQQSSGWLIGVLAAGKSTRMNSDIPKVLHPIAGTAMVTHVLQSIRKVTKENISVVVPPNSKAIRELLGKKVIDGLRNVSFIEQAIPLGTGDAVRQLQGISNRENLSILIAYGDTPLIKSETISKLMAKHESSNATVTLLTSISNSSNRYGRIIRNASGEIVKLTEYSDLEESQLHNSEVNTGLYAFNGKWLWATLGQLKPSDKGEYYLTDLIEKAASSGMAIESITTENEIEGIGVNNRIDLAKVEQIMRRNILNGWMIEGVTIIDPSATYIDAEVKIGKDTTIHPNTSILGQSTVGPGCSVGPNTIIKNSIIHDRVEVIASIIDRSTLYPDVIVGPFSHLRPNTVIGNFSNIGNFAEIKNSTIGAYTAIGHFGYVGDSTIGVGVNIGAGTVTANFDGQTKYRTNIEDGAFIGSDTILIAPVNIGKRAYTAAGSVITKDVLADNLAIGIPAKMEPMSGPKKKNWQIKLENKKVCAKSKLGEAELG